MNQYICTKCSRFCYSAASPQTMRDDHCPHAGCDGHIIPAPEEKETHLEHFKQPNNLLTSNLQEKCL